jgi:hypothetical protein
VCRKGFRSTLDFLLESGEIFDSRFKKFRVPLQLFVSQPAKKPGLHVPSDPSFFDAHSIGKCRQIHQIFVHEVLNGRGFAFQKAFFRFGRMSHEVFKDVSQNHFLDIPAGRGNDCVASLLINGISSFGPVSLINLVVVLGHFFDLHFFPEQ